MIKDPDDAAIEALLRQQFDGAVPDDGFCERVMQQLPSCRRRVTWPVWAGLFVGAALCWLSLQATSLLRAGWQDWSHGEWSTPAIALLAVMVGMSLLAFGWALAETHDR